MNKNVSGYQLGKQVPEYSVWAQILQRCLNPKCKVYAYYGGRGIKVCDRWANSFSEFLKDMGNRPSSTHSIDRVDNNGNYKPENCRWATVEEQARNRRTNRFITIGGETKVIKDWCRHFGITLAGVEWRVKNGWTLEEAITTPVKEKPEEGYCYRGHKLVKDSKGIGRCRTCLNDKRTERRKTLRLSKIE